MTGVYEILNSKNKKVYIGSSKDIERRIKDHKYKLKNGIHHNYKLQNDWNKYGEDVFSWSVLKECDLSDLFKYEKEYIDNKDSIKNGYNIAPILNVNNSYRQYYPRIFLKEDLVKKIIVVLLYYGDGYEYDNDTGKYVREEDFKGTNVILGKKFGVRPNTISAIRNGHSYSSLYDEIESEYYDYDIYDLIYKYFKPDDWFFRERINLRYNRIMYCVDYDEEKLTDERYDYLISIGKIKKHVFEPSPKEETNEEPEKVKKEKKKKESLKRSKSSHFFPKELKEVVKNKKKKAN